MPWICRWLIRWVSWSTGHRDHLQTYLEHNHSTEDEKTTEAYIITTLIREYVKNIQQVSEKGAPVAIGVTRFTGCLLTLQLRAGGRASSGRFPCFCNPRVILFPLSTHSDRVRRCTSMEIISPRALETPLKDHTFTPFCLKTAVVHNTNRSRHHLPCRGAH